MKKYFVGANELNYKSFEQMLKFRQNEARKSILVKLYNMNHIGQLEKFCEHYATIVNIFPYHTVNNNVSVDIRNFYFIDLYLNIIIYNLMNFIYNFNVA